MSAPATQSGSTEATGHVPPAAPQFDMTQMSDAEMARMMQMDDNAKFAMFKLDEFERGQRNDAYSTQWNAEGWYGGDFDKLWLRSEGDVEHGTTAARVEAFWDHAFASYWDWQIGAREDFGSGPGRGWAAFGVQGLAPYWFEVEATAYVGDQGRTAARFRAEYELLFTQRLILQPELEVNLYSKSDPARAMESGLSDAEFGLRLRYEIRREIAPYLGVVWKYRRAEGGDFFPQPDRTTMECQFVVGLRLWL